MDRRSRRGWRRIPARDDRSRDGRSRIARRRPAGGASSRRRHRSPAGSRLSLPPRCRLRENQIREVDILVEGKGAIQLATDVAAAMKLHPPVVFERFGTAHLDFDHRALEFVSSRVETYDPSSRKPQVSPGTLKDDVMRRDFTVNTLLMDWDGTVLDLTGRGLADLESRRIVTPLEPTSTFDEDPLRMLRAIRFAATLDFTLDASVEAAIRGQSSRLQPPTVSMERIRDEFSKLLVADRVGRGLELLDATRLLVRILPQLESGKG